MEPYLVDSLISLSRASIAAVCDIAWFKLLHSIVVLPNSHSQVIVYICAAGLDYARTSDSMLVSDARMKCGTHEAVQPLAQVYYFD